jgi:hypothetical protein
LTCSHWLVPHYREQVCDLLYRFYQRCADAGLPELARLATTVETWWPQILAFLRRTLPGYTRSATAPPADQPVADRLATLRHWRRRPT